MGPFFLTPTPNRSRPFNWFEKSIPVALSVIPWQRVLSVRITKMLNKIRSIFVFVCLLLMYKRLVCWVDPKVMQFVCQLFSAMTCTFQEMCHVPALP